MSYTDTLKWNRLTWRLEHAQDKADHILACQRVIDEQTEQDDLLPALEWIRDHYLEWEYLVMYLKEMALAERKMTWGQLLGRVRWELRLVWGRRLRLGKALSGTVREVLLQYVKGSEEWLS